MYTYLALGDSYTIGEMVPPAESFPYLSVALLRQRGIYVADPVVVATTGWTTDELANAIMERAISGAYSMVTLLIGVNNQYRGRSIENYREEFASLLKQAIAFAGGNSDHVIVLSIPDWGATPFAEGRDREAIARGIDDYNAACRAITVAEGCHHIAVTESTRKHGLDPEYLVEDNLHPSGKEYAIWAEQVADLAATVLEDQ